MSVYSIDLSAINVQVVRLLLLAIANQSYFLFDLYPYVRISLNFAPKGPIDNNPPLV